MITSQISKLITLLLIFSGMNKGSDETNEIVDTIPGKASDPSNLDDVLRQLRRYTSLFLLLLSFTFLNSTHYGPEISTH